MTACLWRVFFPTFCVSLCLKKGQVIYVQYLPRMITSNVSVFASLSWGSTRILYVPLSYNVVFVKTKVAFPANEALESIILSAPPMRYLSINTFPFLFRHCTPTPLIPLYSYVTLSTSVSPRFTKAGFRDLFEILMLWTT